MNKENRKQLERAVALIEEAKGIVEEIKDGEQEKYDNLTEGLQATERGERFMEVVDLLDSAYNGLEEAVDNINESL